MFMRWVDALQESFPPLYFYAGTIRRNNKTSSSSYHVQCTPRRTIMYSKNAKSVLGPTSHKNPPGRAKGGRCEGFPEPGSGFPENLSRGEVFEGGEGRAGEGRLFPRKFPSKIFREEKYSKAENKAGEVFEGGRR